MLRSLLKYCARACTAGWLSVGAPLWAASPVIQLHYFDRPPYLSIQEGQLTGLVGTPAMAAFHAAGIATQLVATPAARQFALLEANTGMDCSAGFFKNPQREAYARFTKPLYQDQPQIALTATSNSRLQDGVPVETVLGNKALTLLVKQSFSYGMRLDELIAQFKPRVTTVAVENTQMLQMIAAGRADYMFIAPEEADFIIGTTGMKASDFKKIHFSNAPRGEERYILCSKQVPEEIIQRLNRHIK